MFGEIVWRDYNPVHMGAALELVDVRKTFGPLVALDGVSLRLERGSIHALLGENGAGKSTLMNIAYGLLHPDGGAVVVPGKDGERSMIRSPADAIARGIGMVHQHFMLAGPMSVLDNVLLGDRRQGVWLNRGELSRRLSKLAASLGLPIDPQARVAELSVGQQQRVEILKAMWRDVRVLILDEPTAVLTPIESEQLFGALRGLRDRGCTVVFISHKLAEVRRLCDRVTVLRRGRVAWEGDVQTVTDDQLTHHMVGQHLPPLAAKIVGETDSATGRSTLNSHSAGASGIQGFSEKAQAPRQTGLRLESIAGDGLRPFSLDVPPGMILGVAGVDGNGQQELAEVVVGLRRSTGGRILLDGQDITSWSLKRRLGMGVAHVPNDRRSEGLIEDLSIADNLALKRHDRPPFARLGVRIGRAIRSMACAMVGRFDIRTPSVASPVSMLSGGNQQKVVLARELALHQPRVIVATNPVRGLDVGATSFVYRQLLEHRAAGCAILLISSELDELLALCDRIAVLCAGTLTLTTFPDCDRQTIGRLMAGLDSEPRHAVGGGAS